MYGSFTAVNSINFEIPKGQIVGLLGHNGAGKTTTLKMLTGFLEPSVGSVHIDERDLVEDPSEVQKKIGYLSEQSPLYPDMTVREYLYYVAEMRGLKSENISEAVKASIDATDLGLKSKDLISTLSRGYKQRVGVAQAILHKPEILVLDEPTNGLDPTQIIAMRRLIKNLAKDSTVILSTHILQEVEAICDRVIIILDGRIALDSSLHDLRQNNNITLSVNVDKHNLENTLKEFSNVAGIESLSSNDGCNDYRLHINGSTEDAAPIIAKKVVEEGWKLYHLKCETKNLESVFNEVNSVSGGGASHV